MFYESYPSCSDHKYFPQFYSEPKKVGIFHMINVRKCIRDCARLIKDFLLQVCQNRPTPSSLKSLASAMNLRFSDFSVLSESEGLRTEKRAFFPATWGTSHLPVTLMVSKDMALNNNNVKNSFALTPIAQFVDQVPSYLLAPQSQTTGVGHINNQGKPKPMKTIQSFIRRHTFSRCVGLE